VTSFILQVDDLVVEYHRRGPRAPGQAAILRAVDHVGFSLASAGSLGIVGESGSGKSSLVSAIIGNVTPASGTVLIAGVPAGRSDRLRVQMVYQDPLSSLNPRLTVGAMLGEVIRRQRGENHRTAAARVGEYLDLVGLSSATVGRRPHELSGGQRQRAGIARALAARPDVLVLDEAVAALDVSVQAAVLATLRDLRTHLRIALLFISHDLAVVRNISDDVLVMTDGRVVERGPVATVFDHPAADYTRALLAASPELALRNVTSLPFLQKGTMQ
jgi:ABC-type glutathione transport system ATPase component